MTRRWQMGFVTGLILLIAAWAAASSPLFTEEVTDYGRSRWRTHYTPTEPEYPLSGNTGPIWEVPLGLSRSQPLVIRRNWDGTGERTRIFHLAGDKLWALDGEMIPPKAEPGESADSYRQRLWDVGFILWSTASADLCADAELRGKDQRLEFGCLLLTPREESRPFASSQPAYWKGDKASSDVLYVGFGWPAAVTALRPTDGKLLGGYIIDAGGDRGIVGAPLIYPDDTVVIGTTSGHSMILQGLADGLPSARVLFIGGRISSSPVPRGDHAFLMASDARQTPEVSAHGYLMAYRLASPGFVEFTPSWPAAVITPAGIPGEAAVDGTTVYFADKWGRLYALRLENGELLWCRQWPGLGPCSGDGESAPGFINNGPGVDETNVYFVFRNGQGPNLGGGQVVALDKGTGRLLWQQPLEAAGNTAPVPMTHIVIVGDTSGYVRAFDKATGRPVTNGGYPLLLSTEPYVGGTQGEEWWEPIGGTATQMTVAQGTMLVGVNSESEERTLLKAFRFHPSPYEEVPDLSLDYLGVPASAPGEGFQARVRATCKKCSVDLTTTVSLSLNGLELARQKVTFRADNGWSADVVWESGPLTPGATVQVVATIDPDNLVPEADETNNSLQAPVYIVAPPAGSSSDRWGSKLTH